MTRVGRASGSNGWLWCRLFGHNPPKLHAEVVDGKATLTWRCPRCREDVYPVTYEDEYLDD